MFNGKLKAVTFSYDDGVTQDIRLLEILNKYGLKCTFNLNSEKFGMIGRYDYITEDGIKVKRDMVERNEVATIYKGHEVAAHTLTHPNLTEIDDDEVIRQVEIDRQNLSEIVGYEVKGMAYPSGGTNHNNRVISLIKRHTGIEYARTTSSNERFDLQTDFLKFKPTLYHKNISRLFELADEFLNLKTDTPKIFYIWGHSYEFDENDTWDVFEDFCKLISGHDDIYYGTNSQILLKK